VDKGAHHGESLGEGAAPAVEMRRREVSRGEARRQEVSVAGAGSVWSGLVRSRLGWVSSFEWS
jgi:hypothetical protein